MRASEFIVEDAAQDYSEYNAEYNGLDLTVQLNNRTNNLTVMAYDDGQFLGQVLFKTHGGTKLYPWQLEVKPEFRGKGIAKTMYDFLKAQGLTIQRSTYQTDAGSGFWDKHRGKSATVWETEAQPKARKVGKRIGGDLYVHKNYAVQAGVPEDILKSAMSRLPQGYDFVAVKYNAKDGSISFIESPDFDTANEPAVGNAIKVYPDGTMKQTKPLADPMIWHHKWQWVPDDYPGFDVSKSKERSDAWKSKLGTNREVSSRIGRQSYWQNWLKQSNLPT